MENSRSRQQLRATLRLRELILSGAFKPGERISELGAVDMLGMSRTPVRLALAALAHEGLLERRSAGGFSVMHFSFDDVFDAIELRGLLEGMAARLAARRAGNKKELTANLHRIFNKIEELIVNPENGDEEVGYDLYGDLNNEFHEELLALAESPILDRLLGQVTALPFASASAFVKLQTERPRHQDILAYAQHQHANIIDAIEQGDAERAFALGQEHARLAADNLRMAIREESLLQDLPGAQLIKPTGRKTPSK